MTRNIEPVVFGIWFDVHGKSVASSLRGVADMVDYGLDFHVVFHYSKASADTARDMTALLSWLGVLLTGYGARPYTGNTVFARLLYKF